MKALSDAECVLLARHGTSAALTELVERYSAGVYHLSLRLLGDRDLAKDATQEVFLRVHAALGRFDAKRSFRAWLYSVAWNVGRDQLRRQKRRPEMTGDGATEPVDTRQSTPFEVLELKERTSTVHLALSRLLPRERAILILREMEGLSYEELAEFLGTRIGTVRSRLSRARLRLKEALLRLDPGMMKQ